MDFLLPLLFNIYKLKYLLETVGVIFFFFPNHLALALQVFYKKRTKTFKYLFFLKKNKHNNLKYKYKCIH